MAKLQVKDAFDLQIGKTPSRKNLDYWTDGTFDWVSIRDLGTYDRYVGSTKERITQLAVEESGIKPVPPNTLIMSFKLSLGKTAITVEPTYTNEAIMAFIDKGTYPVDLGYMFHQLRTKDWTEGTNRAVMGATLNKKSLSESWILLPSEDEQHEAADALDSVIEKLACVRMLQAKLDQLTKSRFVEMFGDGSSFEPHVMNDLLSGIVSGTNVSGNQRFLQEGEFAVLKISSVTKGWFKADEYKVVDDVSGIRMVHPRKGDLLFSRANTSEMVGATAIVDDDYNQLFLPDKLWRLDPAPGVETIFLKQLLSSPQLRAEMSKVSTGTSGSMQNISMAKFRKLKAFVPPLALQQEFAAFVQQVDKLKLIAQQQIEKLQMLYDSLAQEYFSI